MCRFYKFQYLTKMIRSTIFWIVCALEFASLSVSESSVSDLCAANCADCFNNSTCISCQTGLYGKNCDKPCSDKCENHECNMVGHCKIGCVDARFYGSQCDLECSSNITNCMECIIPHGVPECLNCSNAKNGQNCENDCPANCKTCSSTTKCTECSEGYSGVMCECTIPKCLQCDINGFCERCTPGYFGDQCENTCPDCETCTSGNPKLKPVCLSCNDGDFKKGTACLSCPKACAQCSNTTECFKCRSMFYGETCEKLCPTTCDGECDQTTGKCEVCRSKFYGDNCTEPCPDQCGPAPNGTIIVCNQVNAECLYCVPGFYGERCQNYCETNCALLDNVSNCEKATGRCIGCLEGHYGEFCRSTCDHCKDLRCDQDSGHCVNGCKKGWMNVACTGRCSSTCREDHCDWLTGVCLKRCIDGFAGPYCNKVIQTEEGLSEFPIVFGVAVPVILVLLAGIVCSLYYNRRSNLLAPISPTIALPT